MQKRSSKPDVNQNAYDVVRHATGEIATVVRSIHEKNPAAVALGKLGGSKGGKARAASLTAKQRSKIAKLAAQARWRKSK